jgi:small subunit ribosomal protein S20
VANKAAARKAVIQARARGLRNGAVCGRLRTLEKKLRLAIAAGDGGARRAASVYVSALDKAAKGHVIHRNAANRRKGIVAKCAFRE